MKSFSIKRTANPIRPSLTTVVYLLTLCLINVDPPFVKANANMADLKAFSKKSSQFAYDLYKTTVAEKPNENVIISPLSIQTALSMAFMGATGETAQQMSRVMRVGDLSKTALADNYGALMQGVANSSSLKIANKIYVQEKREIKASFNEIATKKFYSEAEKLDFAKNQESADKINKWVEDKTNNKIKNLIDPSALDVMTRMVLVNAIYFKGLWTHQFKKEKTTKQPFWVSETESVEVDMMNQKEHFKYANFEQELDAQAIELTYNNSDVSMIILLPNTRTGLKALEEKLDTIDLAELTTKMYKQEVYVSLPRFKIEFQVQLNQHLQKLGMERMFTDAAEFDDLLEGHEPLKVSEVVHKAFIEVNEEGAEAAAATDALTFRRMSSGVPFFADVPFMFFLIGSGGNIVFMGHLRNPFSLSNMTMKSLRII